MLTYRPEECLGETAIPSAADNQQVCSLGSIEQHLGRTPLPDNRPDGDGAMRINHRADAGLQRGLREPAKIGLLENGDRPVWHAAYHHWVMPRDHGVDRGSGLLSLP